MDIAPVFLPTAYTGPTWELARCQLGRQRNGEMPLEELREELAIRDLHARLGYALDRCDVDEMMKLFVEDGTLTSPRGTLSGAEAIRADLEEHFRAVRGRFHVWSNVIVRMSEGLRRGWVTSNFFGVTQADGEQSRAVGGLAADEVVKQGDGWKIQSHSTTADLIGRFG